MSHVTTHVLDAALGRPAAGIDVGLSGPSGEIIAVGVTDADGRVKDLGPDILPAGDYQLEFAVGPYLAANHHRAFYPRVVIDFIVTDVDEHYHVPLLLSPFAYSTYRGS